MAEVLEIFKTPEIWHVGATELLRTDSKKRLPVNSPLFPDTNQISFYIPAH